MVEIKQADDADKIYAFINDIHLQATSYETNFYTGKDSLQRWIDWRQVEYLLLDKALFLLRNSKFSKQIYYFSDGRNVVAEGLMLLTELYDALNVDYLGRSDEMKEVYEAAGFEYHIALSRMTRFCKDDIDGELKYGEFAKSGDAEEICNILELSMDIKADQLPGVSEIKNYIDEKKAIVIRDKERGSIVSCILWTRLGKGMEWKYWALNPVYKGTTHSVNLLDDYLRINGGVKRTTLFVRDGNPACAIYQRIGFKYDGLKDYVYCFRREKHNE